MADKGRLTGSNIRHGSYKCLEYGQFAFPMATDPKVCQKICTSTSFG